MNWNGVKALVTGAGGFIGSFLAEELVRQGASVRALVHYHSRNHWGNLEWLDREILDSLEVIGGDVRDPFAMRKVVAGRDVVFHLAALIGIPYSYTAPQSYAMTNVVGTLNLMQACLDEGVGRVVHTSTSEVYGTALSVPMNEGHRLQGQSPYSASKIGADKVAESYHLSFGLPVATVRPFNAYGPRQSARAVIPSIVSQALATRDGTIRLGSLDPIRDLTCVHDTVRGFLLAAGADEAVGQTINVGSGQGISIGDLARLILDAIDPGIRIVREESRVRPERSEVRRLICDSAKARRVLGWEPRVSLEEGIAEVIDFVRQHGETYKPQMYAI